MRSSVRRSLAASAVLALTAVPTLGAVAPVSAAPVAADKGDRPAHAGKPADKPGSKGKPADRPVEPAKSEKSDKAEKAEKPEKPEKPAKPEGKPATPAKPEGKPATPAKPEGKPATPAKPAKPAKPESKPAKPETGKSEAAKDAKDNPPGNNGTVKIAGPADIAGHPSNNPHPGCTFLVEWYGFDEGDDIVSSVTFASQAPTADVAISPATDSVFVGGDAAGGGTDLDGTKAYTLSFDGEPHPKQGYHVKLTVNTPYSHGADKKSKVFWVEPCESDAPATEGEDEDTSSTPGATDGTDTDTTVEGTDEETGTDEGTDESTEDTTTVVEDSDGTTDDEVSSAEVLGVELFAGGDTGTPATVAPEAARAAAPADAAEVPTSVDAGLAAFGDFARSPLPLALAGLGAAAALGGFAYRRRVAGQ